MSTPSYDDLPTPDAGDDDTTEDLSLDAAGQHWPEADWQELVTFLNPEHSPESAAATTHRLQTDLAFARLAAPILRMWALPLPEVDVDVDAAWARVVHNATQAATPPLQPTPLPQPSTQTVEAPTLPTPSRDRSTSSSPRTPTPRHWPRILSSPLWAIAILLFIITGYTIPYLITDRPRELALQSYTATTGSHIVHLPDGSRVTLAPGATLVTDGVTANPRTSQPRMVHLNGTGTFDVHADPAHPFIVETHDISAVALGTVFDVTVQPSGAGKSPRSSQAQSPAPSNNHPPTPPPTGDVHVSVTSGKVVVQRQTTSGHHETLAVLGPGQETSVQTFARYFKAGWDAAGAHKTIAEAFLENQAMEAADSARAAQPK